MRRRVVIAVLARSKASARRPKETRLLRVFRGDETDVGSVVEAEKLDDHFRVGHQLALIRQPCGELVLDHADDARGHLILELLAQDLVARRPAASSRQWSALAHDDQHESYGRSVVPLWYRMRTNSLER